MNSIFVCLTHVTYSARFVELDERKKKVGSVQCWSAPVGNITTGALPIQCAYNRLALNYMISNFLDFF